MMTHASSATPRLLAAGASLLWLAACGGSAMYDTAPEPGGAAEGAAEPFIEPGTTAWSAELEARSSGARPMVPVGYGTLSQDEITVRLQEGSLQIKFLPLSEWVIRLTAPDTYRRLNGYKVARSEEIIERALRAGERRWPFVAFVTFFSQSVEETYEPNDLQVRSQGQVHRPLDIIPVTPGFGRERLGQQETQIALYLYSPTIDLNLPMTVRYGGAESSSWNRIRSTLDSELARASSRAGARSP